MTQSFAKKIFDSLVYLTQKEFTEFSKVLEKTTITKEQKDEFMFLVQIFAHIYEHNNFSQAYLEFPDTYLPKVPIISRNQLPKYKRLGNEAVNFHLEFEKLLGCTGSSFHIALDNVVSQNLLNGDVLPLADYIALKDISHRFFANVTGNTRIVTYVGMANFILYSSGNPILFTESLYFNKDRKFGVPNSLLFNSQSISSDRKLTLSIREVNNGFEQKLSDVKRLVKDLRSSPAKVKQFKQNAPAFVQQYGLTIKDIDRENVYVKATIALGDEVVIDAAQHGDVNLFLDRMSELGLYRLISVSGNPAAAAPVCTLFLVCFVAAAVAAAVAIVFVFWVDGIAVNDDDLGPVGVYSGQLLPEIKTLEIAQKFGGKEFKQKVIERMKLDAKNFLLETNSTNANSNNCDC